jgi:hypothetical protein
MVWPTSHDSPHNAFCCGEETKFLNNLSPEAWFGTNPMIFPTTHSVAGKTMFLNNLSSDACFGEDPTIFPTTHSVVGKKQSF